MLIGACNLTLCARFHGAPPIQVVGRIKAVVTGLWPYAEMNIFGSVAAGIFLPTSDIDMVIQGKWATLPLQTLVQRLRLQFAPLFFSFLLFFGRHHRRHRSAVPRGRDRAVRIGVLIGVLSALLLCPNCGVRQRR